MNKGEKKMRFSEVLERANPGNIGEFILNGGECLLEPDTRSYTQRLKEADKKASDFLKQRFKSITEFDEIYGCYCKETAVYQDVFFEMGLITGAKLAFQISEKMRELL